MNEEAQQHVENAIRELEELDSDVMGEYGKVKKAHGLLASALDAVREEDA